MFLRLYKDLICIYSSTDSFKPSESPIVKGDKWVSTCPRNAVERKDMEKRPYAILEDSLMYARSGMYWTKYSFCSWCVS